MSQHHMNAENKVNLSRRSAIKAAFAAAAAGVLFGSPVRAKAAEASAETNAALADAQAEYDQVQSQLDDIAAQYQTLSEQLDKTKSQIEDVQDQIDATQADIEKKQRELEAKQEVLADRVSTSYKNGGNNTLALLLSSSSFEELISNSYYTEKVNARDKRAIEDVHTAKSQLDKQKSKLETEKGELENLQAQTNQQLSDMKAKQDEVQQVLDGLSSEVKNLMAQRDAEVLAAAQAEQEAARQAAQQNYGGGTTSIPGSGQSSIAAGTAQQRVVASCRSTPSAGEGYCAAWVTNVFVNAGFGFVGGNANDMYNSWCTSSNKANLKVGMIVAVSTYNGNLAGQMYGHVGIYIGNNQLMDNIGSIRTINVDSWIAYYGNRVTPRWGWLGGINLEG